MRQPPRLATWLLHRFGVHESLIGDAIEQYDRRRSRRWYWKQVAVAVTFATIENLHVRVRVGVPLAVICVTSVLFVVLPTPWLRTALTIWVATYACAGLGIVLLSLSSSR
jgi:hypothetical protein